MTQTKKQQPSKKKKVAKRILRSVARTAFGALDPVHQQTIIGLTDPFSAEATNARYPDQGAGRTLIQRAMGTLNPATNGSGALAFTYDANFNFPILTAATIAGTSATFSATRSVDWSSNLLNTYSVMARCLSGGIRIVNTLSATDSSGYLIIAKGGNPAVSGITTFDALNFTSFEVHPLTHGGEWHVTIQPKAADAYTLFQLGQFSTNTAISNPFWDTVYIGLFGSKGTSNPLLIEITSNFEYTPKEDAPISVLAQPQPVLDINMQTAVNQTQAMHNGIHVGRRDGHSRKLQSIAKKALVKHVLPFAAKKLKQQLL